MTETPATIVQTFKSHADELARAMYSHPHLGSILDPTRPGIIEEKTLTYARWLKITTGYVRSTVPMLHEAGIILRNGDEEDKLWSSIFLRNKREEIDQEKGYGHEEWSIEDIHAIGNPQGIATQPYSSCLEPYGRFFVDEAASHPYAALGAKGVLEHLAITMASPMERGLRASGIPNIENALRFITSHGELDQGHTKEGNENLQALPSQEKLRQVREGADFTKNNYLEFLKII